MEDEEKAVKQKPADGEALEGATGEKRSILEEVLASEGARQGVARGIPKAKGKIAAAVQGGEWAGLGLRGLLAWLR